MRLELDKEKAASRQLDTAIEMMFQGGDIVSVHTLASAASAIFADLLHARGHKAWRDEIIACFPDEEREVARVLREAQNFFKHADRDSDAMLTFHESTNDETIIVATLEYGELLRLNKGSRKKLTTPMSVFQMWYFAKAPDILLLAPEKAGEHIVQAAQELFPGLKAYPRFHQLALGTKALAEFSDRKRKSGSVSQAEG
ncbi:MAG: hypothetical protein ACFCUQ_12720 [Kiloniellales bacterium]